MISMIGKILVEYLIRNVPPWIVKYWAIADSNREDLESFYDSIQVI